MKDVDAWRKVRELGYDEERRRGCRGAVNEAAAAHEGAAGVTEKALENR